MPRRIRSGGPACCSSLPSLILVGVFVYGLIG